MRTAGRALIGLWAVVLLLTGGTALVLQLLGPPADRRAPRAPPPVAGPAPPAARSVAAVAAASVAAIPPPDPSLLEPAPDLPGRTLPRVGDDGRTPSRAYAAHAGLPAHGPQVAILLEGLLLHDAYSRDAIDLLPPAISFAVSPYAVSLARSGHDPLLDAARQAGHETWLSLPMQPAGSPLDNEGPKALSTGIDFAQDEQALEWALSRFEGYVGVTNALGGLRGDSFANSSAFAMVGHALIRRGLLYVDAGTVPHDIDPGPLPDRTRHADLTLDTEPDAADIEARLSRLEEIAQAQGSALGIAGPLRPVMIERLHAWSAHLATRGVTLVPVSALPAPRSGPARGAASPAPPMPAAAPAATGKAPP